MHAAYYRVGGVLLSIPSDVLSSIYDFSIRFLTYIDSVDEMLSYNSIWSSRLTNIGYISKKDCLNYAISGPVIRGSGIP